MGGAAASQHFACGQKEIGGAEGTWRDAEDGELGATRSSRARSTRRSRLARRATATRSGSRTGWPRAGLRDVKTSSAAHRDKSPAELLRRTRNYWRLWVNKEQTDFGPTAAGTDQSLQAQPASSSGRRPTTRAGSSPPTTRDILEFAATRTPTSGRATARSSPRALRAGHAVAAEPSSSSARASSHKRATSGTSTTPTARCVVVARTCTTASPCCRSRKTRRRWSCGPWASLRAATRASRASRRSTTRSSPGRGLLLGYVDAHAGLPLPRTICGRSAGASTLFTVAAVIGGARGPPRAWPRRSARRSGRRRYGRAPTGCSRRCARCLWSDAGRPVRADGSRRGRGGYTPTRPIDSSVFGARRARACCRPTIRRSWRRMQQVEDRLRVQTDVGGLARYENDSYQQVEKHDIRAVPGNPWFICTLVAGALPLMRAHSPATCSRGARRSSRGRRGTRAPSGVMAEQLHPHTASRSRCRRSPGARPRT